MTIKELRDDLNKVPTAFDGFNVEFSDKWGPFSKDSEYAFRMDTPVVGTVIDGEAREYLLLGSDAMKYYMKNVHTVKPSKGKKWKESAKSRSKKLK
jgi:hypothetical protein